MQSTELSPSRPHRRAGKAWIFVLIALVLAGGGVALFLILRGKGDEDLDLVPRDSLGFITVRVGDALETEPVKKMMDSFVKMAGRDGARFMRQLGEIEEGIGLKLTDIERATIVFAGPPGQGRHGEPLMWFLIRTKKDINKDKVLSFIDKVGMKYSEENHEGKAYYHVARGDVSFCFFSSRLAIIAPPDGMKKCLEVAKNGPGKGPLEDAIKLASGDKYHAVAAGNFSDIFKIPDVRKDLDRTIQRGGPEAELAKVVLSLKTATYTIRADKKLSLELTGEFDSADSAKQAVGAIEAGLEKMRKEIPAEARQKAEMKPLLEAFEQIKPKQNGSAVTISIDADIEPLVAGMMFWVGSVQSEEVRPKQGIDKPRRDPPPFDK